MLRVAAVTAAALSAFLVSCFSKPGEPHAARNDAITDVAHDPDSGSGSGSNGPCTKQPSDNFDTSTDCGTWGTRYGAGSAFGRVNGELEIQPLASGPAYCETNQPFSFTNGTSIKISQAAETMTSTYFKVRSAANGSDDLMVTIDSYAGPLNVTVACMGVAAADRAYDVEADRWWKFAPTSNAKVQAFHSPDGSNWTLQGGPCQWQDTSQVYAELGTGGDSYGGTTYSGATFAHFDDFNMRTCPP